MLIFHRLQFAVRHAFSSVVCGGPFGSGATRRGAIADAVGPGAACRGARGARTVRATAVAVLPGGNGGGTK